MKESTEHLLKSTLGLAALRPEETAWWNRITLTVLLASVVVCLLVAASVWYLYLSSPGYVDYVEGLVLFHQLQAAQGENIYAPSLREAPPYSIPLYGPIFYYLVGGISGSQPSLLPGRLISAAALVILCLVGYQLLRRHCGATRVVSLVGAFGWLACIGPIYFGVNNRVDGLAVCFAGCSLLAAISRSRGTRLLTPALLLLAGFTKPTAVLAAAPVVFLLLRRRYPTRTEFTPRVAFGLRLPGLAGANWGEAVAVASVTAVGALALVMLGDQLCEGNFSRSLVLSNMNPMRWQQAWIVTRQVFKQPMVPVGAGVALLLLVCRETRAIAVYALLAFLAATLTAAKIGSNTNYFIEASWAAGLSLACLLHVIQRHPRAAIANGMVALLLIHASLRATRYRDDIADQFAQWPARSQLVLEHAERGKVLTMEVGALVLAGRQPYVADPHIVARLAEVDQLDDSSLLLDIESRALAAIIAEKDIRPYHQGHSNWRMEVRQAVERSYAPVNVRGNLTVYLPRTEPTVSLARRNEQPEWLTQP